MITATIAIVIAYLLGSLSSAIIVCKLMGLPDPRTEGSKNPGTTNVLRIGGKNAAIITLLGDMLKGVIPVLIAHALRVDGFMLGLVALAAFLGHLFPLYFGFKGGKGVATFLGAQLALAPVIGIAIIITWLIVAFLFRYSSLAALVAAALAPIYALILQHYAYFIPILAMTLLIYWKHQSNIKNLLAGKEDKIRLRK
ncbi:MAG: glycerol-3-phosphate 1-O-acyltransferase PlsY [Gammaproteobacteria bacterium]|nr:glycerol-3-phosphate 1-O-acyltransferase PlsY [Gammaproteobacteria bacterium]